MAKKKTHSLLARKLAQINKLAGKTFPILATCHRAGHNLVTKSSSRAGRKLGSLTCKAPARKRKKILSKRGARKRKSR